MHYYGSGIKDIMKLAWPIMLSMASYTVMDVTDTLMVGWLGIKELAAIGIATTVLFLLKAFFLGLFEGVKILVSQSMGAKDQNKAWSLGFNGLFLALPCAVAVFGLSFFGEEILALFGGPKDIQTIALQYFNIAIYASMLWFFTLPLTNFLQGMGDTKTPMYINIGICVINLVLDPILIYGLGPIPALGVEGSALVSVVVTALGNIAFGIVFFKRSPRLRKFDRKTMRELMHMGWPSGTRWFFDVAGFSVFAALVARLGEASLAANQIGQKIVCLAILPAWGIAEATCIITGHHFGAQRASAVRRTFVSGLALTLMLLGALALILLLSKNFILNLFKLEPDVFELAQSLIILVALFQLLEGIQNTSSLALAGTGDTRFPMLSSLASSWLLMLPLSYLFGIVFDWGLLGMWGAGVIHLTLLSAVVCARFLKKAPRPHQGNHESRFAKDFRSNSPAGPNEPVPQALR